MQREVIPPDLCPTRLTTTVLGSWEIAFCSSAATRKCSKLRTVLMRASNLRNQLSCTRLQWPRFLRIIGAVYSPIRLIPAFDCLSLYRSEVRKSVCIEDARRSDPHTLCSHGVSSVNDYMGWTILRSPTTQRPLFLSLIVGAERDISARCTSDGL